MQVSRADILCNASNLVLYFRPLGMVGFFENNFLDFAHQQHLLRAASILAFVGVGTWQAYVHLFGKNIRDKPTSNSNCILASEKSTFAANCTGNTLQEEEKQPLDNESFNSKSQLFETKVAQDPKSSKKQLSHARMSNNTTSQQTLCTTLSAVLVELAVACSDVILGYCSGTTRDATIMLESISKQGSINAMGLHPTIKTLETRAGAGAAVVGLLSSSENTVINVILPSVALSMMIPSIHTIHRRKVTGSCIFTIFAEHINHDLSQSIHFGNIALLKGIGLPIIFSSSVQECHDHSLAAFHFAKHSSQSIVHVIEGVRQAHTIQMISSLSRSHQDLVNILGSCYKSHISKSSNNRNSTVTKLGESFKAISRATGRHLEFFTYIGPKDAQTVVIVAAPLSEPFILAATGIKTNVQYKARLTPSVRDSVGVLAVKVLRPWNAQEFFKVLPITARNLCIVETTSSQSASVSLLTNDVCVAITNSKQFGYCNNPTVTTRAIDIDASGIQPSLAYFVLKSITETSLLCRKNLDAPFSNNISNNNSQQQHTHHSDFKNIVLSNTLAASRLADEFYEYPRNFKDDIVMNVYTRTSQSLESLFHNLVEQVHTNVTEGHVACYTSSDTCLNNGVERSQFVFSQTGVRLSSFSHANAQSAIVSDQKLLTALAPLLAIELQQSSTIYICSSFDCDQFCDEVPQSVRRSFADKKLIILPFNVEEVCFQGIKNVKIKYKTDQDLSSSYF